jgi:hypothetical protein
VGRTVYALLVGINDYVPPINALYGCRNDVRGLEQFLRARVVDRPLEVMTLLDEDATRDNIVEAFRRHLGRAGAGDVALFAFDGHGSEEPAPPEFAALEPSGRLQVLVCVDTGRRVGGRLSRGIADKELAVLIRDVARRGAHVAVILDCCHSGSGTRDPAGGVRQWLPRPDRVREEHRAVVGELALPRELDGFLPGTVDEWTELPRLIDRRWPGAPRRSSVPHADHVALSACQSFQVAKEQSDGTQMSGVFTAALLASLEAMGPGATYRELLAATRSHVERRAAEQTPVLYPVVSGGPGDALILDGSIQRRAPSFHVTVGPGGLEVDAGLVHGLRAPTSDERFELTCTTVQGEMAGQVRVTEVDIGRSRVVPIGWTPSHVAYRAVVSVVPLPKAIIVPDDAALGLVRHAVETCGPDGGPSAHVRIAALSDDPSALVVRLAVHPNGYRVWRDTPAGPVLVEIDGAWVRVLRADGTPLSADVPGSGEAAVRRAVAIAEHVAQWEQIRALAVPGSTLAEAVRLDILEAGGAPTGIHQHPLLAEGGYELRYREAGADLLPPQIFVRLTNTTDRPLHVALLDLTDRFACRTALFPTQRIAPGHQVLAWEGEPVAVELPAGRPIEPGALARDWIKIVVSESAFDSSAFELEGLDEPRRRAVPTRRASSTLDRVARRVLTRDVGTDVVTPTTSEWGARTVPIVTLVPGT